MLELLGGSSSPLVARWHIKEEKSQRASCGTAPFYFPLLTRSVLLADKLQQMSAALPFKHTFFAQNSNFHVRPVTRAVD